MNIIIQILYQITISKIVYLIYIQEMSDDKRKSNSLKKQIKKGDEEEKNNKKQEKISCDNKGSDRDLRKES